MSTGFVVTILDVISPSSTSLAMAHASVYMSSFCIKIVFAPRSERVGIFPFITLIVLETGIAELRLVSVTL